MTEGRDWNGLELANVRGLLFSLCIIYIVVLQCAVGVNHECAVGLDGHTYAHDAGRK